MDDGSTDGSLEIARKFGSTIAIYTQQNAGPAAARNRGMLAARGAFIAFLDSDDYWLPTFLSRSVEFLDEHPQTVAVSVGLRVHRLGNEDLILPKLEENPVIGHRKPLVLENFFDFWGDYDHLRTGSIVFRRRLFEEAGGQRGDLWNGEDLEYWGYLATFGCWGFIPEALWVGDSARAAAKIGWIRRNRRRRRLCPTIEGWEQRIVPRLQDREWPGFKRVRGRVAANFAQSHILVGRRDIARQIVRNYSEEMPQNWLTSLLTAGEKLGSCGWTIVCWILCSREYQKACGFALTACFKGRQDSVGLPCQK